MLNVVKEVILQPSVTPVLCRGLFKKARLPHRTVSICTGCRLKSTTTNPSRTATSTYFSETISSENITYTQHLSSKTSRVKRQERPGPLSAYDSLIQQGELNDDAHQRTIVKSLQDLFDKISGYRPAEPGFFKKVRICLAKAT